MLETRNGRHSYDKTVEKFLQDMVRQIWTEERCQEPIVTYLPEKGAV